MTMLLYERLVFLTPSIEELLKDPRISMFCISPIRKISPYLKCCYISLNNLLLEILEVVDIDLAGQFVFVDLARSLSKTEWVATGLQAKNLTVALDWFNSIGIDTLEHFVSKNSSYSKGFKHRSASLALKWLDRMVYVSEYDQRFFLEREQGIAKDIKKKQSIFVPESDISDSFQSTPRFINQIDSVLEIQVKYRSQIMFQGNHACNYKNYSDTSEVGEFYRFNESNTKIVDLNWIRFKFV